MIDIFYLNSLLLWLVASTLKNGLPCSWSIVFSGFVIPDWKAYVYLVNFFNGLNNFRAQIDFKIWWTLLCFLFKLKLKMKFVATLYPKCKERLTCDCPYCVKIRNTVKPCYAGQLFYSSCCARASFGLVMGNWVNESYFRRFYFLLQQHFLNMSSCLFVTYGLCATVFETIDIKAFKCYATNSWFLHLVLFRWLHKAQQSRAL